MKQKKFDRLMKDHEKWLENNGEYFIYHTDNDTFRFKNLESLTYHSKMCMIDFGKTILREFIFSHNLKRIDFNNSILNDAVFKNSKLTDIDFKRSFLDGSIFKNVVLKNVDFRLASMRCCKFINVELDNVTVSSLYSSHKIGEKLIEILNKMENFGFEEHDQAESCGTAGCFGAKLAIILGTDIFYTSGANALATQLGFFSIIELLIFLCPYWPTKNIFAAFESDYAAYQDYSQDFEGILACWKVCAENLVMNLKRK